jgi:hypothetical protein
MALGPGRNLVVRATIADLLAARKLKKYDFSFYSKVNTRRQPAIGWEAAHSQNVNS